jgi:hypothetical protein
VVDLSGAAAVVGLAGAACRGSTGSGGSSTGSGGSSSSGGGAARKSRSRVLFDKYLRASGQCAGRDLVSRLQLNKLNRRTFTLFIH